MRLPERIGIRTIEGVCLADNAASQKVMEKCGFVSEFRGVGDDQGERREICRYRFAKE